MYVLLLMVFSSVDGFMVQSMSITNTQAECLQDKQTLNTLLEYDRMHGQNSDWENMDLRCQKVERVPQPKQKSNADKKLYMY